MERVVSVIIGITTLVAYGMIGDGTHLTWWNLFVFGLFFTLYGIEPEISTNRLSNVCFGINGVVGIGVLVLSLSECELLINTRRDFGGIYYFFGTWFAHFFPVAATSVVVCLKRLFSVEGLDDVLSGCAIGLVYLGIERADAVYGCEPTFEGVVSTLLIVVLTLLCGVGILRFFL